MWEFFFKIFLNLSTNLVYNYIGNQIIIFNTPQQTIIMTILVKAGVSVKLASMIILFL